jgi:hypothetical protein
MLSNKSHKCINIHLGFYYKQNIIQTNKNELDQTKNVGNNSFMNHMKVLDSLTRVDGVIKH